LASTWSSSRSARASRKARTFGEIWAPGFDGEADAWLA
jgi:hypothetical protein